MALQETRNRKKKLLLALEKSLGNVSKACTATQTSRATFYNYMSEDKEFKERVEEINEKNIDFAETMLLKNIQEGKETSLIFYLKTKGKNRGYVEKTESDVNVNGFEQLMKQLDERDAKETDDYYEE